MKINDKVQRTDMFGKIDNFTIHDAKHLKYHQDFHKEGYEYAVLTGGEWVKVPREVVEPTKLRLHVSDSACIACE